MKLKRVAQFLLTSFACLVVLLFPASSITRSEQSTATVQVNCSHGQSINKALSKHPNARSLTIEISGLCRENVVVTRDQVTLRGVDPANDGIQADENVEATDAALWVRGAQLVTVENLKLTGGSAGLIATDANLPHLRLKNCRLFGNSTYGLEMENSLVEADDTSFDGGVTTSVGVFAGSRLACARCTLTVPAGSTAANLLVFGSRALFFNSTLTGGVINSDNSLVLLTDSAVDAPAPDSVILFAGNASTILMTRVQVTGRMSFLRGTTANLSGVVQTALSGPPNAVDDSAFVRIGDVSPASGGPPSIPSDVSAFNLRNFSNLTLLQASTINGSLVCSVGANAFCSTPTNVTGTSNCGQCPKP